MGGKLAIQTEREGGHNAVLRRGNEGRFSIEEERLNWSLHLGVRSRKGDQKKLEDKTSSSPEGSKEIKTGDP